MRPELPNYGEVSARDGMSGEQAKIVIIGAGFGGIAAAKELRRASVEVTVIDRQNHHCFQPLLYQVATAALSPADVAWPIRHILRNQKNATVLMAEVRKIDHAKRRVQIDSMSISYDYLVLATGASHAYFGHDEWAEVAPGLKRIEDATRIRRRILIAFERAELAVDEAERQRLLTFVIVGGVAGGISEVARWLDVQQDRAGRTRVGASRSVLASQHFCHWRHCNRGGPTRNSRYCVGGKADGPLCWPTHSCARGATAIAPAIPISAHG